MEVLENRLCIKAACQIRLLEVTDVIEESIRGMNPEYNPVISNQGRAEELNPQYINFSNANKQNQIRVRINVYATSSERRAIFEHVSQDLPGVTFKADSNTRISSAGCLEFEIDGVSVVVFLKSTKRTSTANTSVKEVLPLAMIQTNNLTMVTSTTLPTFASKILKTFPSVITGETAKTTKGCRQWFHFETSTTKAQTRCVNQVNDAVSQGKMIESFGDYRPSRSSGVYASIRTISAKRLGYRPDKISPADILLVRNSYTDAEILDMVSSTRNVEEMQALYARSSNDTSSPLIGCSLKDADALGGKGRQMLMKLRENSHEDCMLSDYERTITGRSLLALGEIQHYRDKIATVTSQINHSQYVYHIDDGDIDAETANKKYATLKLANFILSCDMHRLGSEESLFVRFINYALGLMPYSMPHCILVGGKTAPVFASPFIQTDPRVLIVDKGSYNGIKIILRGTLHGTPKDVPIVIRFNGSKDPIVEVYQLYYRNGGAGAWTNTMFDNILN